MFNELTGKTLSKGQLVDWSISKGITNMTVEEIIYKALDARANITNLSKKYIEGMEQRMSEKKITKENLLELCKEFGTDKVAEVVIAEKTGCSILTIRTYIHKWGIKAMLKAMEGKDITEVLKGVKGMEEKPVLTCEIVEKPVMVVDGVPLFKADAQKKEEIEAKKEVVKQETPQPSPPEAKGRPTGKLLPTALRGKDYACTICETDKTVIISDLKVNQDIEVPFEEFPNFAAEISNFNTNYFRRFL